MIAATGYSAIGYGLMLTLVAGDYGIAIYKLVRGGARDTIKNASRMLRNGIESNEPEAVPLQKTYLKTALSKLY